MTLDAVYDPYTDSFAQVFRAVANHNRRNNQAPKYPEMQYPRRSPREQELHRKAVERRKKRKNGGKK